VRTELAAIHVAQVKFDTCQFVVKPFKGARSLLSHETFKFDIYRNVLIAIDQDSHAPSSILDRVRGKELHMNLASLVFLTRRGFF
jgi:hypothetical protein